MRSKTTILAALSLVAVGAMAATAQPASPPTKASAQGMSHSKMAMTNGPHHALAMAYHENMLTFIRVVQGHTTSAAPVDVAFTRAAVDEMQRSLGLMKQHHQDHLKTLSEEMRTAASGMVQEMETHQAELGVQLSAMEEELKASIPDAKKLTTLATSVHTHLDAMSKMKSDMTMKM